MAQAHDISSQVTWAREISRILDRHCAACHRVGGSAFPLATFQQAQARAKDIAKSVLERRMPPFGAVKGFGELRDDQSLTQEQIELVVALGSGRRAGRRSYACAEISAARCAGESHPENWRGMDRGRREETWCGRDFRGDPAPVIDLAIRSAWSPNARTERSSR